MSETKGVQEETKKKSKVVIITSLEQYKKILETKLMVVADFTATWCGPCKKAAPQIDKLSVKYPKVTFLKVDVDENPSLVKELEIKSMPTFLLYSFPNTSKPVKTIKGYSDSILAGLETFASGCGTLTGDSDSESD